MTGAYSAREKLLLIGYGNTLRGDDGVGPLVVGEMSRRYGDQVRTCIVQQLTPELCVLLAEYEAVLFVDASAGFEGCGCRLLPIQGTVPTVWGTHLSSPAALLALAAELYGARPQAYCLAVPGEDFRLGAELSLLARAGAKEAMRIIEEFLLFYEKAKQRRA